ncbi:MAG TPA: hypothetical protein VN370_10830 [Desulfitobacteriaceae bacterium]|jgi:hypothetical protein|nr:hypothetical protein [Desulfitobacteriaceae bacterium]
MDGLALLFFLSVVVEKLLQLFKDLVNVTPFLPDKFKPLTLQLMSLAFGLILAYSVGLNAFDLMNIKSVHPDMGVILAGLVIGKGANFAHDFFSFFEKPKKATKQVKRKKENSPEI